jgi:hypothetical protein
MTQDIETILTIHGLDGDNQLVRADVLAQKLRAFSDGLTEADKLANDGKKLHRFMIEDLKQGSAQIKVRERQSTKKPAKASAIVEYGRALKAIYNGDRSVESLPTNLVKSVHNLTKGASKDFAHGEISFDVDDNIIRIDDFMFKQSKRTSALMASAKSAHTPYFQGVSIGSFDGFLKVVDSRYGQTIRAKLVTTTGQVEIDCIINKAFLSEITDHFDQRVRVEGMAHYQPDSGLPIRVDVHRVVPTKISADLKKWRGAFDVNNIQNRDW